MSDTFRNPSEDRDRHDGAVVTNAEFRGPSRRTLIVFGFLHLGLAALLILLLLDSLQRSVGVIWGAQRTVVHYGLAASAASFVLLALIAWRRACRPDLPRGWQRLHAGIGATLPFVVVITLVTLAIAPRLQHPPHPRPPRALENARNLAIILSERSIKRGWPPYGGKNFVLSLVAYRCIDIRNPENLDIFFCPPRGEEIRTPARSAYESVTKETLAERRFPELTDFAGRRNDEAACALVAGDRERHEPILAAPVENGVLLGFSDGRVRYLRREDLGLGPDDEIAFGDDARSPLLRCLSER